MNKTLIIVRGIPGSGKSTFSTRVAKSPDDVFSADMFFEKDGVYNFDINKIHLAHRWCRENVANAMKDERELIFVANTFVRKGTMNEYFDLAKTYNYDVFCIIIENRHGNSNVHGCGNDIIEDMRKKFNIQL